MHTYLIMNLNKRN